MFSKIQSIIGRFLRDKGVEKRFRHVAYYENILGTSLEIQVVSSNEASGSFAETAVLEEIDLLEKVFNAYNPSSELSRWQATFEQEISVSSGLAHLLHEAENWRVKTKGTFNPATEALTRLWVKHARSGQPIKEAEILPIVEVLNQPLWEVNLGKGMAKRLTTLPVTLNSIAKGFIIDRACVAATKVDGVGQVLINIGGDLRHFGPKPLSVAIADPRNDAENAVPIDRVAICNQGLATSGDYRRGFQIGEQWYSHLLDPRTGWPVESLIGVSVIAPDALQADVLATAFSILKPEESIQLADSLQNVGILLIDKNGGQFSNAFWKNNSKK